MSGPCSIQMYFLYSSFKRIISKNIFLRQKIWIVIICTIVEADS